MAGRPRRQAMIADLLRRTAAEFDDQPDASPLDYVEFFLASGHTLKDLADDIAAVTKPLDADDWSISGEMIRRYLEHLHGEADVESRLTRARARSSYGLADEVLAIAEQTIPEAGYVAKDRLRVQSRQWAAERFNPAVFGSQKGVNVSISVGALHLDALRARHPIVTSALDTPNQNTLPDHVNAAQPIAAQVVSSTQP